MIRGIKQRYRGWIGGFTYLLILCCTFFVAACGVPAAPNKPLSKDDTPTTVPEQSFSTTTVRPIRVENAQSHFVTYPGGQMNMTIATSPYALCTFTIAYGRGTPSHNAGIVPSTADRNGIARWTWRVDGDAHTGSWPLTITAMLPNGAKTTSQIHVNVAFPPISIVSAQTNLIAAPRNTMSLTIATAPSVSCVLALNFGPAMPVKYLHTSSNAFGIASWTWRVDNNAVAGIRPLGITVTLLDGEATSTQVGMTVQ